MSLKSILDFEVESYPKNYFVNFLNFEDLITEINSVDKRKFFVIDENIYMIYKSNFSDLDGSEIIILKADETLKTFDGVETLSLWLLEKGAKKDSIIVGIGGGVIQDICTFVSHIYYRGIDWIYVPTTLLGQSDSCIGAKCGINFGSYKNQIGVIHAPSKVLINPKFLETLNNLDFQSGLGEMLKLSLTGPNQFYAEYVKYLESGDIEIEKLIHFSLLAKKPIIEEDEFESGLRRILNYGHSFGHAIEHHLNGKIPHGLAVVWGIDVINFIGNKIGVTPPELFEDIRSKSKNIFDFKLDKNPNVDDLIHALQHDKKVKNNKINFAYLKEIGNIIIIEHAFDSALEDYVREYLESDYVFRPA